MSTMSASMTDDGLEQVQTIQSRIEMGDTTVVPLLLSRIRRSRDKLLRRLLARSVSDLATREHLRAVAKMYLDKDYQLRLWALATIARVEDHRFYPLLVRGLVFDEDKRVRSASRRSLRRLAPSQIEALIASMKRSDKDWMQEAADAARTQLMDLSVSSMAAQTPSMDISIEALEKADLGPAGDYIPPEPSVGDPDLSEDEGDLSEGALRRAWVAEREEAKARMGIAEAIAKEGRGDDARTFTRQDCSSCGERIMVEAVLCRYCGTVFNQEDLDEVHALAKVRVVPLPIRSPSHRGSALVLDLALTVALLPIGGLGLAYLLLKDGLRSGQSMGKAAYAMKVVDAETGEPCTFVQSLQRNWVLLVPFFPMIEVVSLAATGTRFADQWAGTRVIFVDDPPATAVLAAAALAMISLLALSLVSVVAFNPRGI